MSKLQYYSICRIIEFLLAQGKEGEFWDFKREWHDNVEDLIKDIICFANTVHDESCYIVFGVDDFCNVLGMEKPRRKQADIIDALSNLVFAGDISPKISVDSIEIEGKDVDILIVSDMDNTPVYLKRNYGKMKAGCIYLRTGDKNTPDGGNADIADIEMLWKKRLGLTKPPLEYIYDRLHNPLEWKEQEGNSYYNIYKPEFTLSIIDDENEKVADEFYSYAMYNESTSFSTLQIKYHGTVLKEYQLAILDSGRYTTPVPEWGYICYDEYHVNSKYAYKYFVLGSNRYRVHRFFYNEEDHEQGIALRRLMEVVLIYESDEERLAFETFIEENQGSIKEAIASCERFSHINTGTEEKTKLYKERLHVGIVLNNLLKNYRIRK